MYGMPTGPYGSVSGTAPVGSTAGGWPCPSPTWWDAAANSPWSAFSSDYPLLSPG